MGSEKVAEAVKGATVKDGMDEVLTPVSHSIFEGKRKQIYGEKFPQCSEANTVVAIRAKSKEGEWSEHLGVLEDGPPPKLEIFQGTCSIMYEEMPPTSFVEYEFAEDPGNWCLALVGQEALSMYKSSKFQSWKEMLDKPTCEAQFRRMLQIGVVTRLYDKQIFPTPEKLKELYQVTDEKTGKLIDLPHPVAGLRVWDAEAQNYKAIDPHLEGAPSEAEKSSYWDQMIKNFQDKQGAEYIQNLLGGGRS